jgi:hypothetical protein
MCQQLSNSVSPVSTVFMSIYRLCSLVAQVWRPHPQAPMPFAWLYFPTIRIINVYAIVHLEQPRYIFCTSCIISL